MGLCGLKDGGRISGAGLSPKKGSAGGHIPSVQHCGTPADRSVLAEEPPEPPFYIEAESANKFVKPMRVYDDDDRAWRGKYVTSQGGRGQAYARYDIKMPYDATLYIWGRAWSNTIEDNSFHFRLNADLKKDNLEEFIWDIPEEVPGCPTM